MTCDKLSIPVRYSLQLKIWLQNYRSLCYSSSEYGDAENCLIMFSVQLTFSIFISPQPGHWFVLKSYKHYIIEGAVQ